MSTNLNFMEHINEFLSQYSDGELAMIPLPELDELDAASAQAIRSVASLLGSFGAVLDDDRAAAAALWFMASACLLLDGEPWNAHTAEERERQIVNLLIQTAADINRR
jgi:hypothetical protein